MKKERAVSDSLLLAVILSLSGGLMDAYSYLARGKVFANAQTGNVLLFSVNLSTGNFRVALNYLFPIMAFAAGVAIAAVLRIKFRNRPRVHWRQIVVLLEAVLFFAVAFIPQSLNLLANSLISLACGAQVESFRKVHDGTGIATTMCIGNLRAGVQSVCEFCSTKDKQTLKRGLLSFAIILAFAVGAVSGNFLIHLLSNMAIIVSGVIMLFAFGIMMKRTKVPENETNRNQILNS